MLRASKIFLIISVLLLQEYYILESPYRVTNVALALIMFFFFTDRYIMTTWPRPISKDTKYILLAAISLLSYIFLSDLLKNDPVEAVKYFLPNLFILPLLPAFEYGFRKLNLYKIMYLVFSISIAFAIFQIFGFGHNLNTLFPEFLIIKSDGIIDPATRESGRASGAIFSIIGFAEYLGIFIIITYYRLIEKREKGFYLLLAIMIIVLFFTQTRSAIYGLLPSILLSRFIYEKKKMTEVIKITALGALIFAAAVFFSETIETKFHRLGDPLDASVIERIQTNYYASVGVLERNPLFGIPKEEAEEVIGTAIAKVGLVFGKRQHASTTHHNQVLYYFRYYGFIGAGMVLWLYYAFLRKIISGTDRFHKMMMLSILIFDFQYSMGHNTKLINNIFLWVILSLQQYGIYRNEHEILKTTNNAPSEAGMRNSGIIQRTIENGR